MLLGWETPVKILQQTSTKLVLEVRQPKWLWLVLLVPSLGNIAFYLSMPEYFNNEDKSGMYLMLLIIISAVFLTSVLLSQVITCIFDKTIGFTKLKRQSWIGSKVIEISLQEISSLRVEEAEGGSYSSRSKGYRVSLVLTSGKTVPITWFHSLGRESKEKTRDLIAGFLNLNKLDQSDQS